MKVHVIYVVACAACFGCTHTHLRITTLRQAETITDLQYQQVLNNLAMLRTNPAALPYFSTPTAGSNGVTTIGTGGATFNYSRIMFTGWLFNLSGTRNIAENWTLSPVNDPARLRRMRCAYQIVLGVRPLPQRLGCDPDCEQCTKMLQQMGLLQNDACGFNCTCDPNCYPKDPADQAAMAKQMGNRCNDPGDAAGYGRSLACNLPTGWFCTGTHWQVPKGALYCGHYGHTCVWVTAEGMDQLRAYPITPAVSRAMIAN